MGASIQAELGVSARKQSCRCIRARTLSVNGKYTLNGVCTYTSRTLAVHIEEEPLALKFKQTVGVCIQVEVFLYAHTENSERAYKENCGYQHTNRTVGVHARRNATA